MADKRKVLIIDDVELAREAARAMLEEAGFEVIAADSPVGAGTLINDCRPDVVLLDVSMPDISGPRFLQLADRDDFFQDFFEGIPVLLYSERPEADLRSIAESTTAAGFLSKGASAEALIAAIDRVTGVRQ